MIDRNRWQTIARLGASLLIVTGITFFYRQIVTQVNSTTIALTFLLATLGIATGWGLFEELEQDLNDAERREVLQRLRRHLEGIRAQRVPLTVWRIFSEPRHLRRRVRRRYPRDCHESR